MIWRKGCGSVSGGRERNKVKGTVAIKIQLITALQGNSWFVVYLDNPCVV